jgi:hypothetical protein
VSTIEIPISFLSIFLLSELVRSDMSKERPTCLPAIIEIRRTVSIHNRLGKGAGVPAAASAP